MKRFTVKFEEVGALKKSWTLEVDELSHHALAHSVRQNQALMSRGIDFPIAGITYKAGDSVDGLVTAGDRVVGKFTATQNR